MVEEELNMFNVLQLLRKLKVSMAVILGDNNDKLEEIEDLYWQFSTINVDDKKYEQFQESKSDIMKFLEGDQRTKVREVCEIHGKNKCSPTPSEKEDIEKNKK